MSFLGRSNRVNMVGPIVVGPNIESCNVLQLEVEVLEDGRVLVESHPDEKALDVFAKMESRSTGLANAVTLSFREMDSNTKFKVDPASMSNTNANQDILDACAHFYSHLDEFSHALVDWYTYPSQGRGDDGRGDRRMTPSLTKTISKPGEKVKTITDPAKRKLRVIRGKFLKWYYLPMVRKPHPVFIVYYVKRNGVSFRITDMLQKSIKSMEKYLEKKAAKQRDESLDEDAAGPDVEEEEAFEGDVEADGGGDQLATAVPTIKANKETLDTSSTTNDLTKAKENNDNVPTPSAPKKLDGIGVADRTPAANNSGTNGMQMNDGSDGEESGVNSAPAQKKRRVGSPDPRLVSLIDYLRSRRM